MPMNDESTEGSGAFDLLSITPSNKEVLTQVLIDKVLEFTEDRTFKHMRNFQFSLLATRETYKATFKDITKLTILGYSRTDLAKIYNATPAGICAVVKEVFESIPQSLKLELMEYVTV
jgi:hypothetical protein